MIEPSDGKLLERESEVERETLVIDCLKVYTE